MVPLVMSASWAQPSGASLRAIVGLTKPRLSLLVFLTTGIGMYLAPGARLGARTWLTLCAAAGVVAAANALNSFYERDTDRLMLRTRRRPLPSGELMPEVALGVALGGGVLAMAVLYVAANPLTALLSFVAYATYAWVYTPMKRYSWVAVLVGAIPGAIPPMMGWTAVTGSLDSAAWALFALMFAWQLPHFFAIAIYLREDYARGGHRVLPLVLGVRPTMAWTLLAAVVLVPVTLLPVACGIASAWYGAWALGLGGVFVGLVFAGLSELRPEPWARRVFLASVLHLSALLGVLLIEGGRLS